MGFKIILSGFSTKENAKKFLDWFEGQGEQDPGIPIFLDGIDIITDVKTGMIEHPDGYEYKIREL